MANFGDYRFSSAEISALLKAAMVDGPCCDLDPAVANALCVQGMMVSVNVGGNTLSWAYSISPRGREALTAFED